MTRLGLKARIDIPVAGTMINVVNDQLQVENPPNGWSITAESGWQEYHNKVDQTFEEIVADLAFFFVASAFRPVWPGRCI